MAYFIRGTGDARTPLQHSRDIFKQYLLLTLFNQLMGKKGSGKPIIVDSKSFFGMGCGDTRRFTFVPQITGDGIEGQNATITGNEGTIEEFWTDIRIDQLAKPLAKKGKMTDKRTIINLREEFKQQIANWFRIRTEQDIVAALTGYITDGVTRLTGSAKDTTPLVNGVGRCFRPDYSGSRFTSVTVAPEDTSNEALLGSMNADDRMNTDLLDELQDLCKTSNSRYPMKPIRMKNGKECYMLILHSRAAVQLRKDPRWEKRILASMTSHGGLENDPIATGAMGIWENIIVKEGDYISTATNGSLKIARNLLLGADAAAMCWGQTLDWTEELKDYHRIYGVNADEIRGVRKLSFDGVDMNAAQVPTAIY